MQLHEVLLRTFDGGLTGSWLRYALLDRIHRVAGSRGVAVLAFGLGGDEVRLVVAGSESRILDMARIIKSATARQAAARGLDAGFRYSYVAPLPDEALFEAVVWAHRAPMTYGATGPLATPWSSHRDMLGFRRADFFDAEPLLRLVDARAVHAELSHRAVPRRSPGQEHVESLDLLLRIAAAVLGVLPGDRRCFRLFAQVARHRGYRQVDVAHALALTARRIRQLERVEEPLVRTALWCVADPALRIVP